MDDIGRFVKVQLLGQSGVRLSSNAGVIYVDPYLSDSVERLEGPQARRLRPAPFKAEDVRDASWVLVTHEHLDHCDPDTLRPLAKASPKAKVVAPAHLRSTLSECGFGPERCVVAPRDWMDLGGGTRLLAVGASHPEPRVDDAGNPWACAYILEESGQRHLFTGDTSLTPDLIANLAPKAPFDTCFLPVNERNHMKEKAGIVGNMTIREAFELARMLKARTLVPQHYDMFASNRVHREEIEVLYRLESPPFGLDFAPQEV